MIYLFINKWILPIQPKKYVGWTPFPSSPFRCCHCQLLVRLLIFLRIWRCERFIFSVGKCLQQEQHFWDFFPSDILRVAISTKNTEVQTPPPSASTSTSSSSSSTSSSSSPTPSSSRKITNILLDFWKNYFWPEWKCVGRRKSNTHDSEPHTPIHPHTFYQGFYPKGRLIFTLLIPKIVRKRFFTNDDDCCCSSCCFCC